MYTSILVGRTVIGFTATLHVMHPGTQTVFG